MVVVVVACNCKEFRASHQATEGVVVGNKGTKEAERTLKMQSTHPRKEEVERKGKDQIQKDTVGKKDCESNSRAAGTARQATKPKQLKEEEKRYLRGYTHQSNFPRALSFLRSPI